MTLLVRLGEGRGREGCLFHKTVDMHFSTGCFSFALCSKKDSVKQKSGSVCSKKKKKKEGYLHGACSLGPEEATPRCGWAHRRTFHCHVSPRMSKKTGPPLRDPRLVCQLACHGDAPGHEPRGCESELGGVLRASPRAHEGPVAVLVLQAALLQNQFSY